MNYFLYPILFILGLAVGSFVNVVSLRYRPGHRLLDKEIIGGRSRCPICRKNLVWHELIPVLNFFWQKGKCRHCGRRLSLQYPLVEILSGLIFVFIPLYFVKFFPYILYSKFYILIAAVWVMIFILFLLLSIIDLRHSIIPNSINLSLATLGLILIIFNGYYDKFDALNGSFLRYYAAIFGLRENIWLNYLFAALLGMAIFGLIIFFSKGRAMGLGDLKLVGALGLIFGWPDVLMVLFLSFIIGSLVSIFFLITRKKKIKDAVPFGPFLVIGASLTFFFGYQIIEGYFKLFGL
jgi:prepilin signal peptidase PulO-like enzyme (type II secretory pathway)